MPRGNGKGTSEYEEQRTGLSLQDERTSSDLIITTNDRIQLALLRQLGQVLAVLLQELSLAGQSSRPICVLAVHPLARSEGLQGIKQRLDGKREGSKDGLDSRVLEESRQELWKGKRSEERQLAT